MYDGLTARYTFSCPSGTEASVRLSAFRALERVPGTARPAVFEVRFACPCGGDHPGLVTHDELDWAPVAGSSARFLDVMSGRTGSADAELREEAAHRIRQGRWPWAFWCVAEECARPVFPSAFRVLAPRDERMLVAVRCPSCGTTSVNVVSREHLDLPYCSDTAVDVLDQVFDATGEESLDGLAAELRAGPFSCTRHELREGGERGHSRQG